jgi:phytoene dehydrogenase-like protein
MRIGFLGPAGGDLALLEQAADHLLTREHASRVLYLGDDGAMHESVARWAERLVGDDPSDEGAWRRAVEIALAGTPEAIEAFLQAERKRRRLRALFELPEGSLRTLERLGSHAALAVYDRTTLDADDIASAALFVHGRSELPRIVEEEGRVFLTPGCLGASGGVLVLDAAAGPVTARLLDATGRELLPEPAVLPLGEAAP